MCDEQQEIHGALSGERPLCVWYGLDVTSETGVSGCALHEVICSHRNSSSVFSVEVCVDALLDCEGGGGVRCFES